MIADTLKQAAFITGRILHQGTGEPLIGRIHITAREGFVVDKVLADGTFAISGDIERLFPKLSSPSYKLNLKIWATSAQFRQGFVEYSFSVDIPSRSNFDPNPPTPPDPLINVGTIYLPVDPVNIRGSVVSARDPDTPIGGAKVEILKSGVMIYSATSNPQGRYRFDNIIVEAPAKIKCSSTPSPSPQFPSPPFLSPPFLSPPPRILQIDFSKSINEEYFRLVPHLS